MFGALVTHPLLDAHTNWGTQLFWPFNIKIAYNNIFVVDPLYTLPFMFCVIIAMCYKRDNSKRGMYNKMGLYISSFYMLLTIANKAYVFNKFESELERQEISYKNLDTQPTPFNNLLWLGSVETEDSYLFGHYSLLDKDSKMDFVTIPKNHNLLGEMKEEDKVKRLITLCEGWYLIEKDGDKTYFYDLRFGQMKMGTDISQFVFCYELFYNENKELVVNTRKRKFENVKEVFAGLMKRMMGE